MEKRKRVIFIVMLMLSIGNYFRIAGNENIRAIQFLSIFVIGAFSGLLLHDLINAFRNKSTESKP